MYEMADMTGLCFTVPYLAALSLAFKKHSPVIFRNLGRKAVVAGEVEIDAGIVS